MTYVSGFVTPVEVARRAEYLASAQAAWPLFAEYGASAMMENWGDKLPQGKQTDFHRAVALKDGEVAVMSWVVWPDKATAEACEASMQTDERWAALPMPFDGTRMIFGGFETIFTGGPQ